MFFRANYRKHHGEKQIPNWWRRPQNQMKGTVHRLRLRIRLKNKLAYFKNNKQLFPTAVIDSEDLVSDLVVFINEFRKC